MIAIYSSAGDVHAVSVLRVLREDLRVPAEIVDLGAFPTATRLVSRTRAEGPAEHTLVLPGGRALRHDQLRAVWWRRPQLHRLDESVADLHHREFALNECSAAMHGVWMSSRCLWMNPILADQAASRKLWQLDVAREVGLRIPETLATNDPAEARAFWERHRPRLIYKAFLGTEAAWRETRLLRPEELALIDGVRHAPVIFQEFIPAGLDLRVTVVGDEVFAAEIDSASSEYPIDVRMDMTVRCAPHALDAGVRRKLFALMDRMGLEYGAIDLRVTPGGEYVFFEINPAGQFLCVERLAGLPISAAVARHLARGVPRRLLADQQDRKDPDTKDQEVDHAGEAKGGARRRAKQGGPGVRAGRR